MECKEHLIRAMMNQADIIGIYPEWNVKLLTCSYPHRIQALEYIQNGM